MKNAISLKLGAVAVAIAIAVAGCNSSDPEMKSRATQSGFSEEAATELSKMELTNDEMESIAEAKRGGLDDSALLDMVKSVHKRKLKFGIGLALQLLQYHFLGQGQLLRSGFGQGGHGGRSGTRGLGG